MEIALRECESLYIATLALPFNLKSFKSDQINEFSIKAFGERRRKPLGA